MKNPQGSRRWTLPVSLALAAVLFAGPAGALGAYRYHFSFDALQSNLGNFPADEFSFLSPALIGPDAAFLPDAPYIPSATFAPPAELNGFSFDTMAWAAASFPDGTLNGLAFSPPAEDFGVGVGSIGDLWVGISFAPGTYGPGVYTSDQFGRAIRTDFSLQYEYTTGTLAIESVPGIPAPGAVVLGTLGAGLVGWLRRRRRL